MARFFVTTPIYYVNDVPHIGHAYTTIAADILARFHRMQGDDVLFLTGTDEHGKKVEQSAVAQGKTARQLADDVHLRFVDLWKTLGISHDRFIRTTEEDHKRAVADFWKKAQASGDIYLGDYEGWYCTPCETFWTEKELIPETYVNDGGSIPHSFLCPTCKRRTDKLKQASYFFRLSRYRDSLIHHFKDFPETIRPSSRRNEILSFLEGEELNDLSVSRTDFTWGIPVPGDPKHVIYVWFDALVNYLTASHYAKDRAGFWPASVHLVGKDILRFHTVYWFAFLRSAGFALPKSVFAHGWWTIDGQKMSKSLGNVVDPFEVARTYGVDAFRYFLFREVPFGQDGNYSNRLLEARINGDLANDLGNLLSRVTNVAVQHFPEGRIRDPIHHDPTRIGEWGTRLLVQRENCRKKWRESLHQFELQAALEATWQLLREANGYVDRMRPWQLKGKEEGTRTLVELLETLRTVAVFLQPYMPQTSNDLSAQILGGPMFDSLSRPMQAESADLDQKYSFLTGCTITKGKHLFERIEIRPTAAPREGKVTEPKPEESVVSIEDFQKIQIRSAVILEAEEIAGSKKLIKLKVDLGTDQRQVVAGIKPSYSPAELIGKKVAIVANMKPAKIMGVESQGMVLAASEGDALSLIGFDREVKAGWKIK